MIARSGLWVLYFGLNVLQEVVVVVVVVVVVDVDICSKQ
jgi:hypothetical protein